MKDKLEKLQTEGASNLKDKSADMEKMKSELTMKLAELEEMKMTVEDEKAKLAKEATDLEAALEKLKKDKELAENSNKDSQAEKVALPLVPLARCVQTLCFEVHFV